VKIEDFTICGVLYVESNLEGVVVADHYPWVALCFLPLIAYSNVLPAEPASASYSITSYTRRMAGPNYH